MWLKLVCIRTVKVLNKIYNHSRPKPSWHLLNSYWLVQVSTCPWLSTMMRSEARTVWRRWAMVRVVQSWNELLMVSWIRASVSASMAAVASSRIRTWESRTDQSDDPRGAGLKGFPVCLSDPSVWPVCLSDPSVCLSVCLSDPSGCLTCLSLSLNLPVCLSVWPVCLPVCLSPCTVLAELWRHTAAVSLPLRSCLRSPPPPSPTSGAAGTPGKWTGSQSAGGQVCVSSSLY